MDVKKVAALSNLPLTNEEITVYDSQLGKILDYVDQLQKTDTSAVSETAQVVNLKNIGRIDKVEPAPALIDGFVKVKAIFANDD